MASTPYDLDAVIAERKQGRTPFNFTLGGQSYTLPDELDVPAILQANRGDIEGGMSRLLGEEAWQRLMASGIPLGDVTLDALFGAWAEHLGYDLGELLASQRSSQSTVGLPRPTSNGTTASTSGTSAHRP